MAKRLGVDVRVTRALLEIGTMCAEQKRFDDAEAIIRATKAHRDDLPHPGTTLAMAYLYQDRLDEAEAELETVLAAFPNHQLGKALLGWTRRQAGQQGWQQPLEEVIDDGRDEWAIRLARTVLDVGGRAPVASRPAMAPRRERPLTLVHPGRYA